MSKCINCKHLKQHDIFSVGDGVIYECKVCGRIINFPRFMGGSKKCEYPKKDGKDKYEH